MMRLIKLLVSIWRLWGVTTKIFFNVCLHHKEEMRNLDLSFATFDIFLTAILYPISMQAYKNFFNLLE